MGHASVTMSRSHTTIRPCRYLLPAPGWHLRTHRCGAHPFCGWSRRCWHRRTGEVPVLLLPAPPPVLAVMHPLCSNTIYQHTAPHTAPGRSAPASRVRCVRVTLCHPPPPLPAPGAPRSSPAPRRSPASARSRVTPRLPVTPLVTPVTPRVAVAPAARRRGSRPQTAAAPPRLHSAVRPRPPRLRPRPPVAIIRVPLLASPRCHPRRAARR